MKDYLLEVLRRAGIEPTECEFEDFEKRLVCGLWNKITNERMDERLIIKNAVDAAPIMLPNGRVGEQYKADNDFIIEGVDDYEIVGLDAIGLTYEKTEKDLLYLVLHNQKTLKVEISLSLYVISQRGY